MITTKAFSNLCSTTKKTIIHYDQIGLIKPTKLKGHNRLYLPKQVLTYQKIALLKSFGLTLNEIKKYLNHNDRLLKLFENQESHLNLQKKILEKRLTKLTEFITNLKSNHLMIIPKIKIIKPYTIYSIERSGRYVDIKKFDKELLDLIGDKKIESPCVTIFLKQGFNPEGENMIIGALTKERNPKIIDCVKIIQVPTYKAVVYTHIGSYSYLSYIWQFLNRFVKENNIKKDPNNKEREIYWRGNLVEPVEDNLITELHIPII